MADKKISQLTAASTPLDGTEVLPIVKSGSTVKVAVSDLTAGRAISALSATLSGGTANGVAYLNASKAVTTGSGFTFDGTNLGLGVASTTPINGTATFQFQSAGGATSYITTGTHNAFMSAVTSGVAVFGTSTGSTTVSIEVANGRGVEIDANRNVSAGIASLATNATNGFMYVPSCAGTPTGTPTAKTGYAPIVVDSTNNKLYFYSGGQWRDAGP